MAVPISIEDTVVGAIATSAPSHAPKNDLFRKRLVEFVSIGSNDIELKLTYDTHH